MSVTLSNLTVSRVSAGSGAAVPSATDPYWSSVSLLTETTGINGANNRVFLDSSVNNFTMTNVGATQGTFSPFSNTGSSGYFDGSGYLTSASNSAFGLGTGDFTIEMWAYPTVNPANGPGTFIDFRTGISASATSLRVDNSRYLHFYNGPANVDTIFTLATVTMSAWNHIAYVRSSNVVSAYINGVLAGSVAVTSDLGTSQPIVIGGNQSPGYTFYGYMSNFRIIKGTAIYTGNFTPPTSPVTAITGTSLLLNFANAGIYDAAKKNDMYTLGDAQVSTAEQKFGTTSMLFGNVGDYVTMSGGSQFGFGTGDFTIEFWTFLAGSRTYATWIDFRTQTTQDVPLIWNNAGTLTYWVGSSARITSSMFGTGVWTHVAVSRASGSTKMFVDGVQVGSTFADSTNYVTAPSGPIIGEGQSHSSLTSLNGYIQDLRITKGVGRYTANFTPPTAAFPTN